MRNISDFMTPCPLTIDAASTVDQAVHAMELQHCNHMPVVKEGELVGVISHREAKIIAAMSAAMQLSASVGDVCSKEPFIVSADSKISTIAYDMAEQGLDYVLVADSNEQVVGIFTTSDACRYIHYLTSEQ